jgi:hypothetical protein
MPDISKAKPISESSDTACLYIQNNLTLKSFDGRNVERSAALFAKAAAVNVPKGEHRLVFDYKDGNSEASGFEFTITFESERFYYVNYDKYTEDGKSKIRVYLRPTEEGVYLEPKE